MSWNVYNLLKLFKQAWSASSWGCELKCRIYWRCCCRNYRQPLREAVSWNMSEGQIFRRKLRQPLREAVSWNATCADDCSGGCSQPLREAVSWNVFHRTVFPFNCRQPLREAVSWNAVMGLTLFAEYIVSLFVRLWVEMALKLSDFTRHFRQPLREAVSWNDIIEGHIVVQKGQPLREAVSWNI